MSDIEELFAFQIRTAKLPEAEREHKFHGRRKWRLDFAWPDMKLAVEIEGGVFSGGRHTRGTGFEADCEKYNCLSEMGWTLLRYTPRFVRNGEALKQVESVIRQREAA